ERQMAHVKDPGGHNIIPIVLEKVELHLGLRAVMWHDFTDPKKDEANVAKVAAAIQAGVPARVVRREPAAIGQVGAFPRPPGQQCEALPVEKQRQRVKQLFQQRRVLMVWDNFESVLPAFQQGDGPALYGDEERARITELFRDWTESPEGQGRLLITCRPAETG